MSEQDKAAQSPVEENKLIAERRAKLTHARSQGNAFPNDFRRTAMADELQRDFGSCEKAQLETDNQIFK